MALLCYDPLRMPRPDNSHRSRRKVRSDKQGKIDIFDEVRNTRIDRAKSTRKSHRARRATISAADPAVSDRVTKEPVLTAEYAYEFIKLLHAGIPKDSILSYFSPDHFAATNTKERDAWLARWANSPLMARASADFNKGRWQDLDKDSRLSLALDKHMAELAYFLYTANYDRAEGYTFKKVVDARTAIMEYVKESDGDADTPFMRAMRDLLSGKMTDSDGPPKMGESIPTERVKKLLDES